MKSFINILLLLSLFFSSCTSPNKPESTEPKQEFSKQWFDLFNGENLEGWVMKIAGYEIGENFGNTFRVEDGILSIRYDQYDSFANRFGALYYQQPKRNYRLKVEYRFVGETTPGAPEWGYRDSGVQFHSQDPKSLEFNQPFPVCMEYNLLGGNGVDERPVGEICVNGIIVEIDGVKNQSYCTPPKVKKTFHGDQWVTLEIDVQDDRIIHFINGEEIVQYKNPRYNPEHELGKQFIENGETRVKKGYISLQSNSHPIDFRSIAIIEY